MTVTAPLWGTAVLVLAGLVRVTSRGPAFYRHERVGRSGRPIGCLKLRTMVVDADGRLAELLASDPELAEEFALTFKLKKDPRVTRLGRILRRYSLDEFPQFINVFLGEMSVVGPRPLAVTSGELESLIAQFGATAKKRMNILPGITGLWQVSGRSDISDEHRFSLDLFYIERWSLGLDLEIVLRTVPAMLSGKGAY